VNLLIPTVRVVLLCRCGQPISFYVAIENVRFYVTHQAPIGLPITTERCRNCRGVVACRVGDVNWRKDAA